LLALSLSNKLNKSRKVSSDAGLTDREPRGSACGPLMSESLSSPSEREGGISECNSKEGKASALLNDHVFVCWCRVVVNKVCYKARLYS
jgi:hypothetical protein